jgi:putative phosphoesterase
LRTVAVIADVHGNAPALRAVLDEIEREQVDLIVSCGDLTWGPLPEETYELAHRLANPGARHSARHSARHQDLSARARFVRGNADRAVLERVSETDRERWMQEHHSDEMREFLATFEDTVSVEVDGLGAVRLCHGSPRSDEECVTPATPDERVREFSAGIDERIVVTAHVHMQFDREVAGIRSLNPGSVGLPYEKGPGAYWALLGPDVDLRRTDYDLDETIQRYRASGQPDVERIIELMLTPPPQSEIIEYGETRVFAG